MLSPSLAGPLIFMEIAITRKAGFRACKGLVVAQSPCYWWVGLLYLSLNSSQATQHISSHKKFPAVLV